MLHDVSTVPVSKGEAVLRQEAGGSGGISRVRLAAVKRQWSDHESIRRDGRSFSKRCRRDDLANRLKSLAARKIN